MKDSGSSRGLARTLWALFALFVVYGTTIPFTFSLDREYLADRFARIDMTWLGSQGGDGISLPDLVQNVLLFLPFGFLGYLSLLDKASRWKLAVVVGLGTLLSAGVEFLQVFSETRTPAVSDVVTNTLGAAGGIAAGMLLRSSVVDLLDHPRARRILEAEAAYPAFLFLVLAVISGLEPFDFGLNVSIVWGKVKALRDQPFQLQWQEDDLVAFLQYFLAAFFACRLAGQAGLRRARLAAIWVAVLGCGLEFCQFIVTSRTPGLQAAVVACLGAAAGALAFGFPGYREKPLLWGGTGIFAVFLSVLARGLYPFRFASPPGSMNWIPFLLQYEKTSFSAVANFVENAMVYFPMGFFLAYFFPGSARARWVALGAAAGMAVAVEIAQLWIPGRYGDITSVVGAVAGTLAGILVLTRGEPAYRRYLEWRLTQSATPYLAGPKKGGK